MTYTIFGQRYDHSRFGPLGRVRTEREARAVARRHLGCGRLVILDYYADDGDEMAVAAPGSADDDSEAVAYIRRDCR